MYFSLPNAIVRNRLRVSAELMWCNLASGTEMLVTTAV